MFSIFLFVCGIVYKSKVSLGTMFETEKQTEIHIERETDRQTERQIERETDRQLYRPTDRKTDEHTEG